MTFAEIQRNAIAEWEALEGSEIPRIYVSTSTCSRAAGAMEVLDRLKAELEQRSLEPRLIEVGCLGGCYLEPLVAIDKPGRPRICYGSVTPEMAAELVTDYIVGDNPRPDLALGSMGEGEVAGIPRISELPMFAPQVRIALRNCGYLDPGNINHYIAAGGYSGLVRALGRPPEEVIEEVSRSGLRGRGGAGFPTGTKWRLCREATGSEKCLICNAHEGDPEAYLGRLIIEGDPHSILEGVVIGAYAIGANRGYIYICAGNTLAIDRLRDALKQMEDYGLLGDDILGSGFGCRIEVREGASDFICGEETAMIRSLEGRRAMPYPRPPFPATSGLSGQPTGINNVETFAHVSAILQKGADWYAGYGTGASRGTKLFVLGGVRQSGVIEVPMGTTLRQIIYDIGGGLPDGKDFKAVRIGSPTGGFIPDSGLDLPVDYEPLAEAGAIMGSGSMIVAGSDACIVDLAKRCLAFARAESCGECVLCREGTAHVLEILTDITEGRGKPEDIDLLLELGEGMKLGSLCALGSTAPNPVLTTIRHFRDEYEAHIKSQQCPSGVCQQPVS